MLGTDDAVGFALDLDEDAAKIEASPDLPLFGRTIIAGASASSAERAVRAMPRIGTGMDQKMSNVIFILIKLIGFNNCALDIEQFLT